MAAVAPSVENCVVLRRVGYKHAFGPVGRDNACRSVENTLAEQQRYSVVYRRANAIDAHTCKSKVIGPPVMPRKKEGRHLRSLRVDSIIDVIGAPVLPCCNVFNRTPQADMS